MTEQAQIAAKFRKLAEEIRSKANAAEAIATGFELIAEIMEPCIDCGAVPEQEPTGEQVTKPHWWTTPEKGENLWEKADKEGLGNTTATAEAA
jgi:hypothetical protein